MNGWLALSDFKWDSMVVILIYITVIEAARGAAGLRYIQSLHVLTTTWIRRLRLNNWRKT